MIKDAGRCFACGKNNPHGLHLDIHKTPDGVELDFVPPEHLQGWHEILHGGITSTLLDELMTWACTSVGIQTVTAEMSVRFRQPVKTGQPLRGTGRVLERRGRLVLAESRLFDRAGTLVAEATGKMMALEAEEIPNAQ